MNADLDKRIEQAEITLLEAYDKIAEHENDSDPDFLANFLASERIYESEDSQLKKVYEQRLFDQDKRTVDCVYGYLDTDEFYQSREDTLKRRMLRENDKKYLDKI